MSWWLPVGEDPSLKDPLVWVLDSLSDLFKLFLWHRSSTQTRMALWWNSSLMPMFISFSLSRVIRSDPLISFDLNSSAYLYKLRAAIHSTTFDEVHWLRGTSLSRIGGGGSPGLLWQRWDGAKGTQTSWKHPRHSVEEARTLLLLHVFFKSLRSPSSLGTVWTMGLMTAVVKLGGLSTLDGWSRMLLSTMHIGGTEES